MDSLSNASDIHVLCVRHTPRSSSNDWRGDILSIFICSAEHIKYEPNRTNARMLANCEFAHAAQAARVQRRMRKHVAKSCAARDDTRIQRCTDLQGHKHGLWCSFEREPRRTCESLQRALASWQIYTANVARCVRRLRMLAEIVANTDAPSALVGAQMNAFYLFLGEYESARTDEILRHLVRQYRKLCREELFFADRALGVFLYQHCGIGKWCANGWIHQD